MDWNGYAPFDPGVDGPLQDLTRAQAKKAFAKIMKEKDERIDQLRKLLSANSLELGTADEDLQALNEWFVENIEGKRRGRQLMDRWYSVVNDIALFLGDVIIARSAGKLKWTMFTGPKDDVAYQRHVIMGFTKVPNPKYNVDVDEYVADVGRDAVVGDDVERAKRVFVRVVRDAVASA